MAANSFGAAHLETITDAYGLIAGIVAQAQERGEFTRDVTPEFAAMAFYGAVEQVLTGWIFGLLESDDDAYARATRFIVETICGGLDAQPGRPA